MKVASFDFIIGRVFGGENRSIACDFAQLNLVRGDTLIFIQPWHLFLVPPLPLPHTIYSWKTITRLEVALIDKRNNNTTMTIH